MIRAFLRRRRQERIARLEIRRGIRALRAQLTEAYRQGGTAGLKL